MKRPGRIPSQVSQSLHRQLNSYALAASAAGVGLLALPQTADAKIVYTPAHVNIVSGGQVLLDLNHDGSNDFLLSDVFQTYTRRSSHFHNSSLNVVPLQSDNRVLRLRGGHIGLWGAALPKGYSIGLLKPFEPGPNKIAMVRGRHNWSSNGTYGPWVDPRTAYLGLEFLINGKVHFGWARLSVTANRGNCKQICATLLGYAYETVPAKPIVAGKTETDATEPQTSQKRGDALGPGSEEASSLGLLARGCAGLDTWRKARFQRRIAGQNGSIERLRESDNL